MKFYKYSVTISNPDFQKIPFDERSSEARKIAYRTADAFRDDPSCNYAFISSIEDNKATVGLIVANDVYPAEFLKYFMNKISLTIAGEPSGDETKTLTICEMLRSAEDHEFVADSSTVLSIYNIEAISRRRLMGIAREVLTETKKKKEILSESKNLFCNDTLPLELDRIFKGKKAEGVVGHPVHYMIKMNTKSIVREVYSNLISALYSSERIANKRYWVIRLEGAADGLHDEYLESMYKSSEGGTIIIDCNGANLEEPKSSGELFESNTFDEIKTICTCANDNRNKVLTIFCVPKGKEKVVSFISEAMPSVSFVNIEETLADAEKARAYLTKKAKDDNLKSFDSLLKKVDENREYYSDDLDVIYKEWFDFELRENVYPQYKDVHCYKQEAVAVKPRGNAIDDINALIGLDSAKSVLNRIIAAFKVRKLFEDRNINAEKPCLHMCFTGNPGTCKTTFARLLAQALKENGVLSTGNYVEVGRADIVGKYVGSTAPLVKQRFKEASGGCLLIDEAYSLCDDKNGMYGDEAINTIIQEMENHRDDVVVVFAGYPDKMQEFIDRNPGMKSRIAFHINFEDYSVEDLCKITEKLAKEKGYVLSSEAVNKLKTIYAVARLDTTFGNGRYARNLLEQAIMTQNERIVRGDLMSITDSELTTILPDDITVSVAPKQIHKTIGFAV